MDERPLWLVLHTQKTNQISNLCVHFIPLKGTFTSSSTEINHAVEKNLNIF